MYKKIGSFIAVLILVYFSTYLTSQAELKKDERDGEYYTEVVAENNHLRREANKVTHTFSFYDEMLEILEENKERITFSYSNNLYGETFKNLLFDVYEISPTSAITMLLDYEGSISYHLDSSAVKKDLNLEKDSNYYFILKNNNEEITFENNNTIAYNSLKKMRVNYTIDTQTNTIKSINEVHTTLRLNNYYINPHTIKTSFEVMTPLPASKVELKVTQQINGIDEFFYENNQYINYPMKEQVVENIIVVEVEEN